MNNKSIETFKKKLSDKQPVLGIFSKTSDPAFVEAAGWAGMDFIILDIEHGPNNILSLQNLIRGAQCSDILPIVRVPDCSETFISKALDIGAAAIQIPQVTCADDVKNILKAARFAPNGERGVCRFVRAANYSMTNRFEYFKSADDVIIIIQLEGLKAIENIDEILDAGNVDIIFIGPYDLSQSLGIPGQVTDPRVEEKMIEIVEKANKKGICVGTFTDTIENANKWKNKGLQYISYSVDVGIFAEACKNIKENII